jgi:hypothetical protein
MLKRLSLLGLAGAMSLGLLLSGGRIMGVHGAAAQSDPAATPAYYIVVQQPPTDGNSTSQTHVIVQGDSSITTVQVGTSGSTVDCTRYDNEADAEAAAALAHPGQAWVVVWAPDALHALLQAAGQTDATLMLPLPLVPDDAVCSP